MVLVNWDLGNASQNKREALKLRKLIITALICIFANVPVLANGIYYTIDKIPDLNFRAVALNNYGQVSGNTFSFSPWNPNTPAIWSESKGTAILTGPFNSVGIDINDTGSVLIEGPNYNHSIWIPSVPNSIISGYSIQLDFPVVKRINNLGVVIGTYTTRPPLPALHGIDFDINTFLHFDPQTIDVIDINNSNTVLFCYTDIHNRPHVAVWQSGIVTEIPRIAYNRYYNGYGFSINNKGTISGFIPDTWGNLRLVMIKNYSQIDLLEMPFITNFNGDVLINDNDTIAGFFEPGGPFIWNNGIGTRSIYTLIGIDLEYEIKEILDINDNDWILVRVGPFNGNYPEQFAILKPVPPPTTPVVLDEGTFTWNTGSLQASWSSTEQHNGIAEYMYAVGTTSTDPGTGYLVPWTSAGTALSTVIPANLTPGQTYYIYVKARSGIDLWSEVGVSDGIAVLTEEQVKPTPGSAKASADGEAIGLTGVVTARFPAANLIYAGAEDRSSGIAVATTLEFALGDKIEIAGKLATNSDGERYLSDTIITKMDEVEPLRPLNLNIRNLASRSFGYSPSTGIGQRGITDPPGYGLSTIGLLVKISGSVNELNPGYALVSDGSFAGLTGIRVEKATMPASVQVGDTVEITGISSLRRSGSAFQMVVKPRSESDWKIVK